MGIYIDSDQEENKRVMEFFGLTVAYSPTYRVIKMSENMAKFKPEDDLSAEAVTKFAQGVLSGDVKRHLMSEEVAEGWNAQPVSVLVGKNFKEVAFDSSKKVFVEFYAPWCKHCNDMQAAWQQLALYFKKDPSVVIASIDATRNDLPGLRFVGAYPTLMFFPMSEQLRMPHGAATARVWLQSGTNLVRSSLAMTALLLPRWIPLLTKLKLLKFKDSQL